METNEPLPSTESNNILKFGGNILVKAIDAKIEELFEIGQELKLTDHKFYKDIYLYRKYLLAPEVIEMVFLICKKSLEVEEESRLNFLKIKLYPIINFIYGTNNTPQIRRNLSIESISNFKRKAIEWWNCYRMLDNEIGYGLHDLPSQSALAGTDMWGITKKTCSRLINMFNSGGKEEKTRQHGHQMSNAV